MSSSSTRMNFKVSDLQKTVDKHLKATIEAAEEEFKNSKSIKLLQAEWRVEQQKRVKALAREINDMSDSELKDWKIDERPTMGYRHETPTAIRDRKVAAARENHEKATRRLDAVSADNGVVSLTQQMLADWFGL